MYLTKTGGGTISIDQYHAVVSGHLVKGVNVKFPFKSGNDLFYFEWDSSDGRPRLILLDDNLLKAGVEIVHQSDTTKSV